MKPRLLTTQGGKRRMQQALSIRYTMHIPTIHQHMPTTYRFHRFRPFTHKLTDSEPPPPRPPLARVFPTRLQKQQSFLSRPSSGNVCPLLGTESREHKKFWKKIRRQEHPPNPPPHPIPTPPLSPPHFLLPTLSTEVQSGSINRLFLLT